MFKIGQTIPQPGLYLGFCGRGGKYVCLGMKGGQSPFSLCVSTCKARGVREKILHIHVVEAQSSLTCIHRLIVTLYIKN